MIDLEITHVDGPTITIEQVTQELSISPAGIVYMDGGLRREFVFSNLADDTFSHYLGLIPTVQVFDASGKLINAQITNTLNTTRIQSNKPITGTLVCSA